MDYQNIKTLKHQVEHCLKFWPETRNSDIELTTRIWKEYYAKYLIPGDRLLLNGVPISEAVELKKLFILPREDNVKRARAYWQNTKKMYPPTDPRIAKKRGMLEDDWRVAMGYPTKESTGTDQPSWEINN